MYGSDTKPELRFTTRLAGQATFSTHAAANSPRSLGCQVLGMSMVMYVQIEQCTNLTAGIKVVFDCKRTQKSLKR
jgi:hypothetical protein